MNNIKIDCSYDELLDINEVHSIQGVLKDAYDIPKLKKNMIRNGVKIPIRVWHDTDKDKYKIIDGVHRIIASKELVAEGYNITKFPVVFVDCVDDKEAKDMILRSNSHYSKKGKKDTLEFITNAGLDKTNLIEELSTKDFKFLNDIPKVSNDDIPKPSESIQDDFGRDIKISTQDMNFKIFQIVFDAESQTNRFWKVLNKIRAVEYQRQDYKDIVLVIIERLSKELG